MQRSEFIGDNDSVLLDSLDRPLRNLRLSVTDRCNLRCSYCMPEADYVWLPREDILHFEEIETLVDVFIGLGVDKVRLTGGEPLLRRDLPDLVRRLAARPAIRDLAMTTNGVLLAANAPRASRRGPAPPDRQPRHAAARALPRLDALRRARSRPRRASPPPRRSSPASRSTPSSSAASTTTSWSTCSSSAAAMAPRSGSSSTWTSAAPRTGRWRAWCRGARCSTGSRRTTGRSRRWSRQSSAPADRFRLPDGTAFGIISSTTEPFCDACDRSRLTADGLWYLCLYAAHGTDLRGPLRAGASADELAQLIRATWEARSDRGAEERLAARDRSPLIPVDRLKRDPHLEMHTRGG